MLGIDRTHDYSVPLTFFLPLMTVWPEEFSSCLDVVFQECFEGISSNSAHLFTWWMNSVLVRGQGQCFIKSDTNVWQREILTLPKKVKGRLHVALWCASNHFSADDPRLVASLQEHLQELCVLSKLCLVPGLWAHTSALASFVTVSDFTHWCSWQTVQQEQHNLNKVQPS